MDTAGVFHAIKTSLDTTFVGPAAGYITALWGILRVTLPLVREWMAARREARANNDRRAPSFRIAYEYAVKQSIENYEVWEKERARLLAEVESLRQKLRKGGADES